MVRLKEVKYNRFIPTHEFQFQMVRLKEKPALILSGSTLFQFQMVRLKVFAPHVPPLGDRQFQFQMVRLKEKANVVDAIEVFSFNSKWYD